MNICGPYSNLDPTSTYLHSGGTWLSSIYGQHRQGNNSKSRRQQALTPPPRRRALKPLALNLLALKVLKQVLNCHTECKILALITFVLLTSFISRPSPTCSVEETGEVD